MALPQFSTILNPNTINDEPIYSDLYKCAFIVNSKVLKFIKYNDMFRYTMNINSLSCHISDNSNIDFEKIKEIDNIVVGHYDKTGNYFRTFLFTVKLNSLSTSFSYDSTSLSTIKLEFEIKEMKINYDIGNNFESFIKSFVRDFNINEILK